MKAVLFDLFGTLVDNATVVQVNDLHRNVALALGVSPEEFANGWKVTFCERSSGSFDSVERSIVAAALRCSKPYSVAGLVNACQIRRDFVRSWLTPRADAVETITELKRRGYRTGLLSNCSQEVPELWQENPLSAVINEPLFSSKELLRKPMPQFYRRALERLKVNAHDCLYVADGDNGELAAARTIGMPALLIRPPYLLNDFRQDPEEDWNGPRIERLAELLELDFLQQR